MKKFLLFIITAFLSYSSFALVHIAAYRWRNDDGGEASATWQAAENAPVAINAFTPNNIRLRLEYYADATSVTSTYSLQFRKQGDPTYTAVPASGGAFILATSPFVVNGNLTTSQLSPAYTGPFIPGYIVTTGASPSVTTDDQQGTELEWVIKPGPGILPNTTYEFAASANSGPTIYDVTASLMTTGVVAVNINSLDAVRAGKNVLVHWVVSPGTTDSYEVERSADGSRFNKVGAVAGGPAALSFSDGHAPATSLFYRLKLLKNNGSFTYTNIVKVAAVPGTPQLSVYPNPAKDMLNLRLDAPAGDVQVTVVDAAGKFVKSVNLRSSGNIITASADISSLHPGGYFIKYNNQTVQFIKL